MASDDNFTISSNFKSFAEKQKNLFDQLKVAEKSASKSLGHLDADEAIDLRDKILARQQLPVISTSRTETKYYKKKESIFKKPEAPIGKCLPVRRVADHHKNPHKWTKYSLDSVSDMSERTNTAAAMSFLREIEDRKSSSVDNDDMDVDGASKIVFKKSAALKRRCTQDSIPEKVADTTSYRSSKLVMPEYVVGQKAGNASKRPRTNRNTSIVKSNPLKLDHLNEYDDGD